MSLVTRFCISIYNCFSGFGDFCGRHEGKLFAVLVAMPVIFILMMLTMFAYMSGRFIGIGIEMVVLALIGAGYFGSKQAALAPQPIGFNVAKSSFEPVTKISASNPKLNDGWYAVEFEGIVSIYNDSRNMRAFEEVVVRYLADNMTSKYCVLNFGFPAAKVIFKSEDDAILFRMRFAQVDLTEL